MENKKGITLIALIITIILMLILSAVVINVTVGENGLFKTAKYAAQKYNEESAREKLELVLGELSAYKYFSEDYNEEQFIEDYIESKDINISGNIVTIDGMAFEIDRENLDVIGRKQDYVIITAELKERLENGFANILIKVETDKEIETITFPNEDGTTLIVTTDKQSISKDLKVEIGKEYEVTVKTKDGKKVTQTIKIEREKVRAIILNKSELELKKGENETDTSLKATVLPIDAEDKTLTWTSSDESVATVIEENGIITVTAIGKGTAIITATANDGSEKSASCKVIVRIAGEIQYSWEELGEIAKIISDKYGYEEGQINETTEEINVNYKGKNCNLTVGDWTTVDDKKVRILGFNHDDLVTSITNETDETVAWAQYGAGTTNTKAGISFEFVDFLMENRIATSETYNYGWEKSEIRDILNINPDATVTSLENKEQIKQVVKKYIDGSKNIKESKDYLWLLSCSEMWEKNTDSGRPCRFAIDIPSVTPYKIYSINTESSFKKRAGKTWWTRDKSDWHFSDFVYIGRDGNPGYQHFKAGCAVFPGFSI